MENGKSKLDQALQNAIKLAEKYELQLPHVSDCIYALVRLAKNDDEILKKAIESITNANRIIKCKNKEIRYAEKFLKKSERKQLKAYREGLYDSERADT